MSNLLPIIEELASAATHEARARWLLRCPLDILGRYDMTIRNRLMHAGFPAGLAYLDDLRIVKSGVRDELGRFSAGQDDVLERAAEDLLAAAAAADTAAHEQTTDN